MIDGKGIIGQITAVGMLSAEVTLTTEKDQSVPVMVVRNGVRAIAVGTGREGTIDSTVHSGGCRYSGRRCAGEFRHRRHVPRRSRCGNGCTIVDKNPAFPFARITSAIPTAGTDQHRFVKVLTSPDTSGYPKPDIKAEERKAARERSGGAGQTAGGAVMDLSPVSREAMRPMARFRLLAGSLLIALILNLLPWSGAALLRDTSGLSCCWCCCTGRVHQPRNIGQGWGFVLGSGDGRGQ